VSTSGARGAKQEITTSILEDRHNSTVRQRLDSIAGDIEVPRTVLHYNEQLAGVGFDGMLPPVHRATDEYRSPRILVQGASLHRIIVGRRVPQYAGSVTIVSALLLATLMPG
jgi:hypothetical protein